MTRVFEISDVHLELLPDNINFQLNTPESDIIIVAGDVHTSPQQVTQFLQSIRTKSNAIILYVLGNHEFWGHQFFSTPADYKEIESVSNCFLLHNKTFTHNNVCFIGSTLWTDYNKGIDVISSLVNINDYQHIFHNRETITPFDIIPVHQESLNFICNALEENEDKKRVVISHHAPSYKSVPERYSRSTFNGAYASDLSWVINRYQPNYWFHGHTHTYFNYYLGDTNVICNPIGYYREFISHKENIIEI